MPRNLILYGSSGTGKTLLLLEVLRMKVAHFKLNGLKFRIILATYDDFTTQLKKDMRENHNIEQLLSIYNTRPRSMEDLQMDFTFEFHKDKSVTENVNSLISALKTDQSIVSILVLDELKIRKNQYDLRFMELQNENVHVHLAVSPISYSNDQFSLILPEDKDTHSERLLSKHRNSFEISLLLLHLKPFVEENLPNQTFISDKEDLAIGETCFSSRILPLWIEVDDTLKDETILEEIEKELSYERKDVVFLYDWTLEYSKQQVVKKACKKNNWRFIDFKSMTGSEAGVIVLYQIPNFSIEDFSRARSQLIIVQR